LSAEEPEPPIMIQPSPPLSTAALVRRIMFVLVALGLALGNLFPLFRGLGTQQAMDQAQIGREVSRGNGLSTRFIRPVEYAMAEAAAEGREVPFTKGFHDTMHAPLYPLILGAVFKAVDATDAQRWGMSPTGSFIYPLDRVVAAVSTVFFLLSIWVSYRLACRIFDTKIAGVTALLMLFSGLFWDFATSGMPHMGMLLFFSCGLYAAYVAEEATREGRSALLPALTAGVFFSLMGLVDWLAVWILLGYLIYAAVVFRPRGVVALAIGVLMLCLVAWPVVASIQQTGSPFGISAMVLQESLGSHLPDKIMRAASKETYPLELQGILFRVGRMMTVQVTDLLPFLGGILAAPLFFVALLHRFKRAPIASFRWMILLMWVTATVGMAIYGVSSKGLHPNQVHILFAPVMTAYGLALLAVLWSRLDLGEAGRVFGNGHLILVVVISAAPLLLELPRRIREGITFSAKGIPEWPPYAPPLLNLSLQQGVAENQIVVSDQPWAVAWYADRTSVWLPLKQETFNHLEERAKDLGTPFAGILITPSSYGSTELVRLPVVFEDFTSLVLDGAMVRASLPQPTSLFDVDLKLRSLHERYPYRIPLFGQEMIFYSNTSPAP
jgi:hypothetical protein